MKTQSKHPQWAIAHKTPGTELRCINGKYYLYEVKSRWNKAKKRAQKITGKMLGRITEANGFIHSKTIQRPVSTNYDHIQVKEYGASFFLKTFLKENILLLEKYFPGEFATLLSAALFRLLYQSPLKNMQYYFAQSFMSEYYKSISLAPKHISALLETVGQSREKITSYFKELIKPGEHVLIDVTAIHTKSESLSLAKKGYNSSGNFDPQANLLMIFSNTLMSPAYYRLLPGNVRDVKAFKLSLVESGISDAILIADKGFYSESNVEQLEAEGLQYIVPLRRNSSHISYEPLNKSHKEGMDGFFKYRERYIWFYQQRWGNRDIIVFLNNDLKNEEEQDYLDRIQTHPEKYTYEEFKEKSKAFGTFAVLTNLTGKTAEDIYNLYKARINIECAADTLKNLLQADKSYMRDATSLEGWMFINFLALVWYYKIYQLLVNHNMLSKYSPKDILMKLVDVRKLKINNSWHLAETPNTSTKIFKKLSINIT